jgi:hypothetical protein
MEKNTAIDKTQKIIKKSIDAGLLIEPYSHLWLKPRVDLLFDKKLSSGKDLKKNSSNYFLASLQNKKFIEELCSVYAPLSSYFDGCDYEYFKHDLLNFLVINLQTKQLLVIRVDQEYKLLEVDIDFDYSFYKEITDMDTAMSSKLKPPDYKKFLNCDYLGLINEFITLIAMISNLLSKLKQVNMKSSFNDDPTANEIRQDLDDIRAAIPALDETALGEINSKLKKLNYIAGLIIASSTIIIDRGSINKRVDILCRNDTPSNLLLSLREKLQIFFPKVSYEI